MSRFIDLTGERFGRLLVLNPVDKKHLPETKSRAKVYLCLCDCGKTTLARASLLSNGDKKSCGCLQKEVWSKKAIETHTTHNLSHTKLYKIWLTIKQRCKNPKCKDYKHYGERGISICKEWERSFVTFQEWALSNGYANGLTIDRINVNGNYEPSNCRWTTQSMQTKNKRNNIHYNHNGENIIQSELCKKYNINISTFRYRIKKGISVEEAISTPIRKKEVI